MALGWLCTLVLTCFRCTQMCTMLPEGRLFGRFISHVFEKAVYRKPRLMTCSWPLEVPKNDQKMTPKVDFVYMCAQCAQCAKMMFCKDHVNQKVSLLHDVWLFTLKAIFTNVDKPVVENTICTTVFIFRIHEKWRKSRKMHVFDMFLTKKTNQSRLLHFGGISEMVSTDIGKTGVTFGPKTLKNRQFWHILDHGLHIYNG